MCNCKEAFYCRECGEMFCEDHPCSCVMTECPQCGHKFEK